MAIWQPHTQSSTARVQIHEQKSEFRTKIAAAKLSVEFNPSSAVEIDNVYRSKVSLEEQAALRHLKSQISHWRN